jgi:hypothetical protein
VEDGAIVHLPEDAMDVEIEGTPVVVVRVTKPQGNLLIPELLREAIKFIRERVVTPLLPFVRQR